MTERVGEEKQFLECSTSGFEFRLWQSRRARGKLVVLESRSALLGPQERRHWNTRNSGNNWKAHVEGLLKVEEDDSAIVKVEISLSAFPVEEEGAYSSSLTCFCLRRTTVWIATVLLVLRVGHFRNQLIVD